MEKGQDPLKLTNVEVVELLMQVLEESLGNFLIQAYVMEELDWVKATEIIQEWVFHMDREEEV